jgi:hypothetical protein
MKQEFKMSMIGELNYFLGLQVKQTAEGIFISQSKYAKDLFKRFGLDGKCNAPNLSQQIRKRKPPVPT